MKIGESSRGGLTRGDPQARAPAMGGQEKDGPGGIVDEDSAARTVPCGSADQTRDVSVDALSAKWEAMPAPAKADTRRMQRTMDNGPESRGRRPPWRSRMVPRADARHPPRPWRYAPPYQST